jgi:alpha-tubulin suppressor-like RCC1 family protein
MNLLLIDSEIPGLDIFMNSCNSNTKYVVYHNEKVTFQMMDKKIASLNISRYNYLGFVFTNDHNVDKIFIENKPYITHNGNIILNNTTTNFINYLVKKYYISTIDFLACSLLSEIIWKNYFDFIKIQSNVIVRASNDLTGNLASGGDWILETTGENIEKLYFNSNIQYWNYLLDSAGYSNSICIITPDNSNNLYNCGHNPTGALGFGDSIDRTVFTLVTTNITGKKIIGTAAGEASTLIITNDTSNNLYSTGRNFEGQLGLGDNSDRNVYTNVTPNISGKKVIAVSVGSNFSLMLTSDATNNLYGCGYNGEGQLGLGDTGNRYVFTNITTSITDKRVTCISTGAFFSVITTDDATDNLYSTGYNIYGQLGLGDISRRLYFQNATINISGKNIINVSVGEKHSLILTNDSTNNLYSCGYNGFGQLGLGDNTDRNVFTSVTTNISGKTINQISGGGDHSLILINDTSNNLYACGSNNNNQLGTGTGNINTFQITSNATTNPYYNNISAGRYSSYATTGTEKNNLYSWGDNFYGQLALGNKVNQNFIRNVSQNVYNKKIIFNYLMNLNTPTASGFTNFNYGTNNVTYYTTASDFSNNTITIIPVPSPPQNIFPDLSGTIASAYSLSPASVSFSFNISFTINCLYLSRVYYQYSSNSSLTEMSTNSSTSPYYIYNGQTITIYTNAIFQYLVITSPPTTTGSQFSNLNKLIISANDTPRILSNTKFNYTFYNVLDLSANINNWDVSGITTMSSMFRDCSFNNSIVTWKPQKTTDMSYMFDGARYFNQKISYDNTNNYWDVSNVTQMQSIFNTASTFNNSQNTIGSTMPMNWILNPNVNITDDVSFSALTVANGQTLIPNSLVYLNIGIWSNRVTSGNYTMDFSGIPPNTVGISNEAVSSTSSTFFIPRYNIAGQPLWSFKIDCTSGGPNDGSITTDLSRNVIVSGRFYGNGTNVRFYNYNNVVASSDLSFIGAASQTVFLTKYNSSGNFLWRARTFGSAGGTLMSNTSTDSNGNVYCSGRYQGTGTFQSSDLVTWKISPGSIGVNDGYVLKYDKNGFGQWFAKIGSTGSPATSANANSIIVDSNSDIYAIGQYDTSTNIYDSSNSRIKSFYSKGNWASKYDSSGYVLWATNFRSNDVSIKKIGYSLNTDVYYSGSYGAIVNFVNQSDVSFVSLTDISNGNGFIVKYDSSGNCSWSARNAYDTSDNATNSCICSDKQFQDLTNPQQGLKFSIYNGYFEDVSATGNQYGFGFFYSYYPYYSGTAINFNSINSATSNQIANYGSPGTSADYKSFCWFGYFRARKTGTYRFITSADHGSYLMINGNIIVNNRGIHPTTTDVSGTCYLIAGIYYYIQILYGQKTGVYSFKAGYAEPDNNGNATTNYVYNGTGLGVYYVPDENYMLLYDNWINQPLISPSYSSLNITSLTRNENYLYTSMVGSSDPQVNLSNRPPVNPNIYKYIHIKYKLLSYSGTLNSLVVYYGDNTSGLSEGQKTIYNYPTPSDISGSWQNAVIDMSSDPSWNLGNWINYRLDPIQNGTANILFEYFILSNSSIIPLNQNASNIYSSGYVKGNTINIYNSNFYYNTTPNGVSNGNTGQSNSLFKQYTDGNINTKSCLVKYNYIGQCIWSVFFKAGLSVSVEGVYNDKTGNVYAFGQYRDTLTISDKNGITRIQLPNTSNNNYTFLAAYSSNGEYLWATNQTSSQDNQVISSGVGANPLFIGNCISMS